MYRVSVVCKLAIKWYQMRMCASWLCSFKYNLCHSRPQRPRSFWSAPRIATSGRVQRRKSVIHGLPVTLRMLWVKSDKSDWFWSQSIVFINPFKTGPGQRSWFLVLTKRSSASGDENVCYRKNPVKCNACAVARKIETDCFSRNVQFSSDLVVRISRNLAQK